MFASLKMKKSFLVLALIVPFMTIVSFIIYTEYIKTKENVFVVLKEHLIKEKIKLFKNYSDYIVVNVNGNIKEHISFHKTIASHYEEELRLLQGDEIKYLYLLYKDDKGKLRFLLDSTENIDEKAELNQKFDPQTNIWNMAYETKIVQIVEHDKSKVLWVSIAYPLLMDGKVIAVLGADFTYDVYTKIVNTLEPMEKLYLYVSVFMAIMLMLAYILVFMYYLSRKKSFIDPLTKVYNRQYLSEFLETSSLQNYHLMMIDLDHFKHVNDSFGHDAGDEVLIKVVQEMKSQIRKEDILIRFGGEEFLLLVYKRDVVDSIRVANRIREVIAKLVIDANSNQIHISISIGINPFPYYAKNIEEAIKIADEQLYIAKASGRNRVEVFDEACKDESFSSKRISDIQLAIDENRIKCAYQPIYINNSDKILKYEMLIRLLDKDNKIIPPNDFLPSIRHTQVYIKLTGIVLDTALNVLDENDFNLSMNLDLQDILNDDILSLFKNRFKDDKALASRLTIEILEHEEITDFEFIKERLSILKELGFGIALDDFGSGYANFRYLIDLDIDILKIDGSIIKNIDKDKSAYNIVKTIVGFAKSMDMKTVAEQVETFEEFKTVSELDVDYLQGYYLGRPDFKFVSPTSLK